MELPDYNPDPEDSLWALANYPKLNGPMYLCNEWCIAAAKYLMQFSNHHKHYTDTDINRVITPPILCNQATFAFIRNPSTDKTQPVGFATWAWLCPNAEYGYISGMRKLQPYDFPKILDTDIPWVIDLVSPFGDYLTRFLCTELRNKLSKPCLENGFKGVKVKRSNGRLGFFYAKS